MYPTFQDPTRIEDFYSDVFDSYFGAEIRFLERYPEVNNYQQIIDAKSLAQKLSQQCLSGNNYLDGDISKRIKKVLKLKFSTIKKMMVERILLGRTANILIGFNWNINLVVSHSNSVGCNIPVCALQLVIKQKFKDGYKRIVIELEKTELASFVQKLKGIEKQLK